MEKLNELIVKTITISNERYNHMALGFSGSNGGITPNVKRFEKRDIPLIKKVLKETLVVKTSNHGSQQKERVK